MEHHVDARLTKSEGRRFALTLAAGFAALAAVGALRGREATAVAFATLAAIGLVCAIAIPETLGPLRRGWMLLGDAIGGVMRPIVLSVLYWAVLTPAGVLRRRLGTSPLSRDRSARSYWIPMRATAADEMRRDMEHMF